MTKKLYNHLLLFFLFLPIFTCQAQPPLTTADPTWTRLPTSGTLESDLPPAAAPAADETSPPGDVVLMASTQEQSFPKQTEAVSLVILSDTLAPGWQDWSWDASLFFNSAEPIYFGTNSARVSFSAGWGSMLVGITFFLCLL